MPDATLRDYSGSQLVAPLAGLAELSMVGFMGRYAKTREFLSKEANGDKYVHPEHEALWFYLLNHAVADIAARVDMDEPLGAMAGVVERYYGDAEVKVLRAIYYLALITTRESRHVYINGQEDITRELANYPEACGEFIRSIRGADSTSAASALMHTPPSVSAAEYFSYLVEVFRGGKFAPGFGGEKWACVAEPLRDLVIGKTTPERLLDIVFTLCHNGGPIFNKGMLYHPQSNHSLLKILDVQRAGQIPKLIDSAGSEYVTAPMRDYVIGLKKLLGDGFGGAVDWYAVQALGAKGKYISSAALAKLKAKKAAIAPGAPPVEAIYVAPGEWVLPLKRNIA